MAITLRLRLEPDETSRVLDAPQLAGIASTPERELRIYYDTPEHALRQGGYRLWTAQRRGRWSQGLSGEGCQPREQDIQGEQIDRTKLPAHGKLAHILRDILADSPLLPQFHLESQCVSGDVALSDETRVSVALERGEIHLNGLRKPFRRLELAVAGGDAGQFHAWLSSLVERGALRLEEVDPIARGYDLRSPPPVTHHKASPLLLEAHASGEEAFGAIVGACLAQARANRAAVMAGQMEGVHQMRVGLRRLRSCLKLFRPLLPRELSLPLVEELRWLNGFLGPARDWDVFVEEGLAPVFARFPDKRGLQILRNKVEAVRASHHQNLRQSLDDPRYHRLQLHWQAWLLCRAWRYPLTDEQRAALEQPALDFATALLKRHHRRVVKRGERFAELNPAQRHALRIRIKELRYAAEFFASLYPGSSIEVYAKSAAALQDCLGALNDLAVAERLLDEAKIPPSAAARQLVEGWTACKGDFHEYDFPPLWERFLACERPWKSSR